MSEWWTYRLSDFLMFAPRTYHRLFELHNAEVWPLQIVTIAAGLAALWLAWRGAGGRVVAAVLAAGRNEGRRGAARTRPAARPQARTPPRNTGRRC